MKNTQIRIKMGGRKLSGGTIILSKEEFNTIADDQNWIGKTLDETIEIANRDYKYLLPKQHILLGG